MCICTYIYIYMDVSILLCWFFCPMESPRRGFHIMYDMIVFADGRQQTAGSRRPAVDGRQ